MKFSSPSDLLGSDSELRPDIEAKEQREGDPEQERLMLELIEDLKARDPIGVGNKGDFYAITASRVGVKHLARPEKMRSYENSLRQEGRLQTMALLVIERARAEHQKRIDAEAEPDKKEWLRKRMPATVPAVIGYAQDEAAAEAGKASEYLVMETVKGKTLSHLMFQKMAERLYARDPQKYAVLQKAADWREDVLADTLFSHVDELKGLGPDEGAKVVYNSLHGTGVVSAEIALQVGAAIKALNKAGIFHRDLHERNVMISDDGTRAWIIDFGSAKFDKNLKGVGPEERGRAYDLGEAQLWDDQNMVASLPGLTSEPKTELKPGAQRIRL